jgi:uncharacterized protein
MSEGLQAEHAVDFTYRRSVGGNTGRFLAGLARGELWASRVTGERTEIPPVDHDPVTGQVVERLVRVADTGTVRSWTWVAAPLPEHPLDRPFAFALVQLDGADTSLFHVVDAGEEAAMLSGMRVRADWRDRRIGSLLDIRAFVPDGSGAPAVPAAASSDTGPVDESAEVVSDIRLRYGYEPGIALSGFLRALAERRIEGGRCPVCHKVYVPTHPRCPVCGAGPLTLERMEERGTIVSYTVVHIPFHGMTTELPFAWAWIQLNGADVPFAHLLGDVSLDDLQVGQLVEAVWVPDAERGPTWESIRYFRVVDGTDRWDPWRSSASPARCG